MVFEACNDAGGRYCLLGRCHLFQSKALLAVAGVEEQPVFLYLQLYASQDANMVNVLGQTSASATRDTLEKPATKVRRSSPRKRNSS